MHGDKHRDHHDSRDHHADQASDDERGRRRRTTLVIARYGMGDAPAELSLKLVQTHLGLLDADDRVPYAICLYAEGVRLAVEGSPVLDELRSLAEKGARVVVCTTCLNFFGLADKLQAGVAGSMKDIIEMQWNAKRVITL